MPQRLNHVSEHRGRSRKRSFIGRLGHNIKKSFNKFRSSFKSEHKEYRPYLGSSKVAHPTQVDDPVVNDNISEPVTRKKRSGRSRSGSAFLSIGEIRRRWERRQEERNKRKLKKRAKRKYRKEQKKRDRIDFIRKFLPNYKRETNIPFEELSAEQAAEVIKQHQKNYFYYTVNSTALFIIAYLAVYMMYQLMVLTVASKWKLDSVLFYYDLAFNDYSPLWTKQNIILVTLSGPAICLILGFLFFRFFSARPKVKGFVKLFFLWVALNGFNLFFGAWATGISFDQGFGYVPAWLYLNVFWQIFIALIFLFILGLIGYYSVPKFLDTSKSAYRVRPENKTKFLFFQVIVPYLIGSLIIILVKIPNNLPYDTGNLITLTFAIAPMIFNKYARPTVTFEKEKKSTQIRWLYMVIFVVLILAYRIGLNNGLHITMFYDFTFLIDITPL